MNFSFIQRENFCQTVRVILFQNRGSSNKGVLGSKSHILAKD